MNPFERVDVEVDTSHATDQPDHGSRLVIFRERVPTTNVLRSVLLLIVLCFLCVALFPREKVPVALSVRLKTTAASVLKLTSAQNPQGAADPGAAS